MMALLAETKDASLLTTSATKWCDSWCLAGCFRNQYNCPVLPEPSQTKESLTRGLPVGSTTYGLFKGTLLQAAKFPGEPT